MGADMRDETPVLIGAGQFTYRGDAEKSPSPLELLKVAAERAAVDAGLKGSVLADLDALAVVAFSIDAPGGLSKLQLSRLGDPPASLARALSASPSWQVYTETGGNSPQQAVNVVCERIAQGEAEFALVTGAEFLGSLMKRMKSGAGFEGWGDEIDSQPQRIGDAR
ncbi:MAG: acetyl-CoA acetyltransferase, partial [Caulobacter segnis]